MICVDHCNNPPLTQHPGFVHLIREALISVQKKTCHDLLFLETKLIYGTYIVHVRLLVF